jgi:hypothetical protein
MVRESVLFKKNKLPPELFERVNGRFDLIRRTLEMDYANRPDELASQLQELDEARDVVRSANKPLPSDAPTEKALAEIAQRTFRGSDGRPTPYLTPRELHFLQISRGNLDEEERAEIERHVVETQRFLSKIMWTADMRNLVKYAHGHHEKLDGSGYPLGLHDKEISLQARIITLADMFDALTAADRPYKDAMSSDDAFAILRAEAEAGKLDPELVDIMERSGVYQLALETQLAPDAALPPASEQ